MQIQSFLVRFWRYAKAGEYRTCDFDEPEVLFCDEPNSGLDPETAIVIDQLIHEITHEFGMTTIVNTHDMNSVLEIGDHVVFMKEGHKVWEGTALRF